MIKKEKPAILLAEEIHHLVMEGRTVEIKARGSSMRPFIQGGRDSIVLGPAHGIRTGDILLCRIAQKDYVIHRLVRKEEDGLILMGDGNLKGTEHCTADKVVAKAIRIVGRKRTLSCDSPCFRFLSFLWWRLLPVRRYLLGLLRAVEKVKDIIIKAFVEYYGKQVEEKDIIARVKKAWTRSGKKVGDIKEMDLYIKPEENAVYYVINGTETGAVEFE